jgi:cyclopropane fatty-acyl-phospholipid synthase-like methyltransferase
MNARKAGKPEWNLGRKDVILTRPRILDVGCGPGGPTLELARLSDGEIIGLDIHQPSLDKLSRRIEEAGLYA